MNTRLYECNHYNHKTILYVRTYIYTACEQFNKSQIKKYCQWGSHHVPPL